MYKNQPIYNEISGEGEYVEKITYDEGTLLHLSGHPYPYRGMPSAEALSAINKAKHILLKRPWRYTEAHRLVLPYALPLPHLTPTALGVLILLKDLPFSLRNTIAHIIEYDAAYRFRLMDLATETSKVELTSHPFRELTRLIALHKQRDYPEIHAKLQKVTWLRYLLLLPPVKKTFIKAIQRTPWNLLTFDEIDAYWTTKKIDYNYFGIPRLKRPQKYL